MKLFIAIISLMILATYCQTKAQIQLTNKTITRDFKKDINTLLPQGEHLVDIMDEVIVSPRRQELQEKFMKAMQTNPDWFLQQQKRVEETGEKLPYDTLLGMSEAEWEEFIKIMSSMNDMKATSSESTKITIVKAGNLISFKAVGKLSSLNNTIIDIKNKTVTIEKNILKLLDTICVTDPDNVFKSSWRGYKFQFSYPDNITIPSTLDELAKFSMSSYGFTLGLFDNTGKTFLKISGSDIKEGKKLFKYEIPIVFQ